MADIDFSPARQFNTLNDIKVVPEEWDIAIKYGLSPILDGNWVVWKKPGSGDTNSYDDVPSHRSLNGDKRCWTKDGLTHRENGPASIGPTYTDYWLNGRYFTDKTDWEAAVAELKAPAIPVLAQADGWHFVPGDGLDNAGKRSDPNGHRNAVIAYFKAGTPIALMVFGSVAAVSKTPSASYGEPTLNEKASLDRYEKHWGRTVAEIINSGWELAGQKVSEAEWVASHRSGIVPLVEGTALTWRDKAGLINSVDGLPAVRSLDPKKPFQEWWKDGLYHREDGPARINEKEEYWLKGHQFTKEDHAEAVRNKIEHKSINGYMTWVKIGTEIKHRISGPAIDMPNCKKWYQNDQLHRIGGPAVDGLLSKEYWIHGRNVSKEEHDKYSAQVEAGTITITPVLIGKPGFYCKNAAGLHHAEGLPSYNYSATLEYRKNGQLHREDGPAYIGPGSKSYYLDGQNYTETQWKKKIASKTSPAVVLHDFGDGKGAVKAHQHTNGGGWVAETALVDKSAYVGPKAAVYGRAIIRDKAQITGRSKIFGHAVVGGEARVSNSTLENDATVSGYAKLFNSGLSGVAVVGKKARIIRSQIKNAVITGTANVVEVQAPDAPSSLVVKTSVWGQYEWDKLPGAKPAAPAPSAPVPVLTPVPEIKLTIEIKPEQELVLKPVPELGVVAVKNEGLFQTDLAKNAPAKSLDEKYDPSVKTVLGIFLAGTALSGIIGRRKPVIATPPTRKREIVVAKPEYATQTA